MAVDPRTLTGADVPAIAEDLRQVGDGTFESLVRQVEVLAERLGPPMEVFGPAVECRWQLADGTLRVAPLIGDDDAIFTCLTEFLDAEESAAWQQTLYLQGKAGDALDSPYHWNLCPPGGQELPADWECLPSYKGDDWDELRTLLEYTLDGVPREFAVMPPAWGTSIRITWTGPMTAQVAVGAGEASLMIDGQDRLRVQNPDDDTVRELIDAMLEAMSGHEPDDFERDGWIDGAACSSVTTG